MGAMKASGMIFVFALAASTARADSPAAPPPGGGCAPVRVLFVLGMGRGNTELREQQDDYRFLDRRLRRAAADPRRGFPLATERVAWETEGLSLDCAERLAAREGPVLLDGRPFHERFLDVFCAKLDRAHGSRRGFVALRRKEIKILEASADYAVSLYGYLSEERRESMQCVLASALRAVPPGERVVLVTHSLGGVMAYDVLRNNPDLRADLWVSFAAPIVDLHLFGWDMPLADLPNVERWLTFYDSKDILASPMAFAEGGPAWRKARMPKNGSLALDGAPPVPGPKAARRLAAEARVRVNVETDLRGELFRSHSNYWKDQPLGRFLAALVAETACGGACLTAAGGS
jgi:hypothetical protein